MNTFPENIQFKYSWRKYQERVLHELEDHLYNRHLHVIAPPGSGKTILGLEVMKRLNQPTLVLAPTIAIRNQWIQRFCELFLDTDTIPEWISRDIKNPKFLTVSTYQGMYAACNNRQEKQEDYTEEEEEIYKEEKSTNENLAKIVNGLKAQKVKTIVIDEAHHLKNEWWDTLTKIKKQLDPVIVALTATPPYDVSPNEWQRYTELNGPVDTEITVPELVKENDLCSHQDYIYFTLPSESEKESINKFRNKVQQVISLIREDATFVAALENLPAYANPKENFEWIYDNFDHYINILVFLNSIGRVIDSYHFEVVGVDDNTVNIPQLDNDRLISLLQFYLFKEKELFSEYEDHKELMLKTLKHFGVIEKKTISFELNRRLSTNLTSSISKLEGIKKISDLEFGNLKNDLRMVILCDFIRKEFFISGDTNDIKLDKIGVMPVFEKLRRTNPDNIKLGVLTGSLIIIPKTAYASFAEKTEKYNLKDVSCTTVPFDNNYLLITPNEQLKHNIVTVITQIFEEGNIEILVGTKSLLGEGWDAPCINTLILASFVGSFVLSNQMRGRAIRAQKGNIDKTGNIWHLVCIDPTVKNGGNDLEMLQRRFRGFIGISFKDGEGIENGIARLDIPKNIHKEEIISIKNDEMFSNSLRRDLLKIRWHEAIDKGVSLVEEITVPYTLPQQHKEKTIRQLKDLYFNKTIGYLIAQLLSGITTYLMGAFEAFGKTAKNIKTWTDFYIFLTILTGIGFVTLGRKAYKSFKLYITYRDITKDIQQIGQTVLKSLIDARCIHTPSNRAKVITDIGKDGDMFCYLHGGTSFEKSVFIESLIEILSPIDSPRYIIIRKSKKGIIMQKDYHAVPEVIGRNKKLVQNFASLWHEYVGECELVYVKTPEGRKILLKSRIESLSAQFDTQPEKGNKWR